MRIQRNALRPRRRLLAALTLLPLARVAGAAEPAGAPAPEWQVLKELRGKVVLVDFWASWCVPCRRSFPWMNALLQQNAARGLAVVAVNVDQDRALAETFLRDVPARFRVEYDQAGVLARQFGVRAMPTSMLPSSRWSWLPSTRNRPSGA